MRIVFEVEPDELGTVLGTIVGVLQNVADALRSASAEAHVLAVAAGNLGKRLDTYIEMEGK